MLGLDNLALTRKKPGVKALNKWDVLTGFEDEVRQETMAHVMASLLKAADEFENREVILNFLKQDSSIARILGDDDTLYSDRISQYSSVEGLAADLSKVNEVFIKISKYSKKHPLLKLPIAIVMLLPTMMLGIYAVCHLVVIRLLKYVGTLKSIQKRGLNGDKFGKEKNYKSDYLPRRSDWDQFVRRITALQNLCISIVQNPEKASAGEITRQAMAAGMTVHGNGRVIAGNHLDKQYVDLTIEKKGWDAESLMMAVEKCLSIVDMFKKMGSSKREVMRLGSLGKQEKRLMKGVYKELNFWILDLVRGVTIAAKKYSN